MQWEFKCCLLVRFEAHCRDTGFFLGCFMVYCFAACIHSAQMTPEIALKCRSVSLTAGAVDIRVEAWVTHRYCLKPLESFDKPSTGLAPSFQGRKQNKWKPAKKKHSNNYSNSSSGLVFSLCVLVRTSKTMKAIIKNLRIGYRAENVYAQWIIN